MYLLMELWTHRICLVAREGTLVVTVTRCMTEKGEVPPHTPSKIRKAKPSYAKLGFFIPVHGGQ